MLQDQVRVARPKIGKAKKKIEQYVTPEALGPQSFKDLWMSASKAQWERWSSGQDGQPVKDKYLEVWRKWNNGEIDGLKHNDGIREIMDAMKMGELVW